MRRLTGRCYWRIPRRYLFKWSGPYRVKFRFIYKQKIGRRHSSLFYYYYDSVIFFFSEKIRLAFYVNRLLGKRFTWNASLIFSENTYNNNNKTTTTVIIIIIIIIIIIRQIIVCYSFYQRLRLKAVFSRGVCDSSAKIRTGWWNTRQNRSLKWHCC